MDRALEYAPGCHKFKILKAECLALLGRYPEAQSVARYNDVTDDGIRSDGCENVAHATCLCIVIFYEWTQLMQMPCMFMVYVCIMRTALTRPSSSLSKPCAWLLTTKRLDWHAEWVHFYARLTLTVVFRPKCRNRMLQLLFEVFCVTFVNLLDRITLRMIIFAECQGTESQEGGGEQGVQRGKLWGSVWPVLWGTNNRPKQHQDKRQTLLQQGNGWIKGDKYTPGRRLCSNLNRVLIKSWAKMWQRKWVVIAQQHILSCIGCTASVV